MNECCISFCCVTIPVDDDCTDPGAITTHTVTGDCTPMVLIDGSATLETCLPGVPHRLEMTGCCGTVRWLSITGPGAAVIDDPDANPTTFTISAEGVYQAEGICCDIISQ